MPTDPRGTEDEAPPDGRSPEALERHWVEHTYRGDVPQLTLRAVVTGAVLGGITGVSNLYVGLKTGWSLGVVVTASVMGWAFWAGLSRLSLVRRKMSILEINAMASTASSAGYSTGLSLVSAISAYVMVVGHHMAFVQLSVWVLSVALLGVFVAIPLKRQLINYEQLPFPTGRAAAETLRGLYAEGRHGYRRARALLVALCIGVGIKWGTGGMVAMAQITENPVWGRWALPAQLPTAGMVELLPWLAGAVAYTWMLEVSGLLVAAGTLMGWRVCWSLLVGAIACYGLLAPRMVELGVVESASYGSIVQWSLWAGASLMVVSGMLLFFSQWSSIVRAARELRHALAPRRSQAQSDPMAGIEVPMRWFLWGFAFAGAICVFTQRWFFGIPVGLGICAVILAVILAIVAARVTGETDVTPSGALGKITQFGYGTVMPQHIVPNLMTASITAGAAASAADLLTDFKSGYMLGANPRKQFWAQFAGVFVGVAVVVPVFRYVLVPDPAQLGSPQWPAPAAQVWRSVAELFRRGLDSLDPIMVQTILVAALVGVGLVALDRLVPRIRPYVPSPTGVGLAFILPAFNSISFFIGGLIALVLMRRFPGVYREYTIPVAAGLIAGESLMGVFVAILQA